jgi:phosphatidylglycerol---prolipoprotein diacylglyceryl transferase
VSAPPRPVLVQVGPLAIPSYPAFLYLGCVTGVLLGAAVAAADGLDDHRFALAAIALLIPALAGARILYVLQHREAFRARPHLVWHRAGGGSSLLGGLVLAVLFSPAMLALARLPFWGFWDAAAVTMLTGLAFTRVGCLLNGCCSGRRLGLPVQLVEIAWAAAVLALVFAAGDLPAGARFAGVTGLYAAARLALEPARDNTRARSNAALFGLLLVAAGAVAVLRL